MLTAATSQYSVGRGIDGGMRWEEEEEEEEDRVCFLRVLPT